MYNAEEYTISVRKERMDGDVYWVARVEELPDIMEFGETRDEAYNLALDTITTGQEMCLSEGTPFPAPKVFQDSEASGRVTLRLPKSVHANCIRRAEEEGVSLNSYILTCVTAYRAPQEAVIRATLFDDIRKGLLALTYQKGYMEILDQAAFAYSKKGKFNVVLNNADADDVATLSVSAREAFKEIDSQGWGMIPAC